MSEMKQATLKALINDVIMEIMVKTNAEQVYLDDKTTLAAKLSEMIEAINLRAKLNDVSAQIDALRKEIMGDTPQDAYNTFTEMAQYISQHKDVADALTAAIGSKAEASTVAAIQAIVNGLGGLATKDDVSYAELDPTMKEKWDEATEGAHTHTNWSILNMITEALVEEWNSKLGVDDNAASATKLAVGRTIKVNLASTSTATFDGTGNVTPGVSGTLPISRGGTGATTAKTALTNLGLTATVENINMIAGATSNIQNQLDGKASVYISEVQPTNMTSSDLWFDIS